MAVLRMFMTSYFHHCRWWVGKYCTGWPDEHSNIQWTTQCSLSSQVHCASMCMMAITRKLHLLHFSRNEGMPSIPEKWSGRYTHLGPMWFPNAADFQNWGYTLNSGNLASQAPPANKNVSFGGVKHKKSGPNNFFRQVHTYKKYILQKKWSKTVNPALSGDPNYLHPPIWGCHHQLNDHHRNPNINTEIIQLGN